MIKTAKTSWQTKKLGEILKLEYGKPLPKSHRKHDGLYPVYGANGVKDFSDKFYFDKPSIIVGRKGSAGEITLTKTRFWPLDVTYFVTFDKKKYDLNFLYNLLDTLELTKFAKGVKPGINRNDIYSIKIKIPPLPEQHRIVKILDEVFEKIAKAKENVEKNLKNTKDLFKSVIKQDLLKKRFDEVSLDSVCKKQETYNPLIRPKNYFKYVDISSIDTEDFSVNIDKVKDYVGAEAPSRARKKISKNDILFSTVRPNLNRNAEVPRMLDDAIASTGFTVIKPDPNKINPNYLSVITCSGIITSQVLPFVRGASYPAISDKDVFAVKIPLPSATEQKSIVAKLDALSAETKKLEAIYKQKLADLEELKKSVLKRAFNGDL